jgi:hypothetical protein
MILDPGGICPYVPVMIDPGKISDPELIRAAIEASGLSARKYAEMVLVRDERTIRRWVSGKSPIPKIVREMLLAEMAKPKRG